MGKNVCFVANLAPRKLKGILSQGMILSAEDYKTGKLTVLTVDESIAPGSKIG